MLYTSILLNEEYYAVCVHSHAVRFLQLVFIYYLFIKFISIHPI
jgi:hypothetical protein